MEEDLLMETEEPMGKIWLIIAIVGILGLIITGYVIIKEPFKDEISPINGINLEQFVCSQVKVTPSWVSTLMGSPRLIGEGFDNFDNSNSKDTVDLLMNAQVYFVYDDNSDCKNQMGYFGTEWERYVKSGYTINCGDV